MSQVAAGRWRLVLSGLSVLAVLVMYVFLVSLGRWTYWPETSRYYDDLAAAFQSGQLNLDIEAPPALLALSNPYEPSARNSVPETRKSVDEVWDLSFYNGKFYLYWGPVPALLLLVTRVGYPGPIPDQYLVFGFAVGLFFFEVLLLFKLHRSLFPKVPNTLFLMSVVLAGLAFPIPVLLSRAAVYEATILGGQFFLLGGLYIAARAVEKDKVSRPLMILAVMFWGLAAGSRTIALIPATFLTFVLIYWGLRKAGRTRGPFQVALFCLQIGWPLVLTLIATAWYNWARFGSIFETGLRYTLTFHNLQKFYGETFSAAYVLPSLWTYLLSGFDIARRFPFLVIGYGHSPSLLFIGQSSIYHFEEVTGLILSSPIVLFSLISLWKTGSLLLEKHRKRQLERFDEQGDERLLWISVSLVGAASLSFGAILFYFNVSMRFLGELAPALMLFTTLGVWEGYQFAARSNFGRRLYVSFVFCLFLVTIGLSILLAMSANYRMFHHHNPGLIKQLVQFFGT
ncbi:MAG TPA: hypothetical protein VIU38_09575 [Anaerolineales bacterium]